MSLPSPAPRRRIHTRQISCESFRRDDGLWDIEARIVDNKNYRYREQVRGARQPEEPVHEMTMRVTIDGDMVVRDIEVATLSAPYATCHNVAPAFRKLVGHKIGGGWRRIVQECVGGVKGCTHLRELLLPVATVAFQTLGGWPEDGRPYALNSERAHFVDGCIAWAADGEVVATFLPEYSRKTD